MSLHIPEVDATRSQAWYKLEEVRPGLTKITEPYVHPMLQSNIWWLRGTTRDVVIDAGLGIVPLRQEIPQMFERDPELIITHTHLDHVGGAYEFDAVAVHEAEANTLINPGPVSLDTRTLYAILGVEVPEGEADSMLRKSPHPDYDPGQYEVSQAFPQRLLRDGDVIDTLGTPLEVIGTPGHSPGSICIYDPHRNWLFTGDTIYKGHLLDTITGADQDDYRHTMKRLLDLESDSVFAGHGPELSLAAMKDIASDYLARL